MHDSAMSISNDGPRDEGSEEVPVVGIEKEDTGMETDGSRYVDTKHEPDGTHPAHLDGINEGAENSAVDNEMTKGYFKVGMNKGAKIMSESMNRFLRAI